VADRGKAREIAVERDQVAAVLQRDGSEHRIGHEVPYGVRLFAELAEECEVSSPGRDRDVERLRAGGLHELKRVRSRSRYREDPAVGSDAQEGVPHECGYAEGLVALECPIEPGTNRRVQRMIVSVRGQDHIRVEQEHSAPLLDVDRLIEHLAQRSIGSEVDARPRTRPAPEHRYLWTLRRSRGRRKLTAQRRVYHLTERLAPLASAALCGEDQLV